MNARAHPLAALLVILAACPLPNLAEVTITETPARIVVENESVRMVFDGTVNYVLSELVSRRGSGENLIVNTFRLHYQYTENGALRSVNEGYPGGQISNGHVKAEKQDGTATVEWRRLEPAHDPIRNQPDDVTRRMVLARSAAGDLAVAYLPDNDAIEIDVSGFPSPLAARWFDPVHGRYTAIASRIENRGAHRFPPPAKGDWVMLLQRTGG